MKKLKNDESGFGAFEAVLIVIIVILIGAVGWLVYKNQHKDKATVNQSSAKTAAKSKSPAAKAPDPYAGWATYTSQDGFTFKYPTDGWAITGARNPGYTQVTGSQLNGSEYQVGLTENEGHDLSTNGNTFNIYLNLGGTGLTNALDNYTNAKSDPGFYANMYKGGAVTTLSNGLQAWLTSESSDSSGSCNPTSGLSTTLWLVSNNMFYMQVPSGRLMEYQGTFCFGYHASTTLSYQQQVNSTEMTVAKEVLASFKFQ